jgi:chorismate dehydratase
VSYLNTLPLVHGLASGRASGRIDLSYAPPAELAVRMAADELDVALLPVIELARLGDLEIVPGLAIGTFGPSRSVLLVSNGPVEEVETVALDRESRTSNALIQVLFRKVWHRAPKFVDAPDTLEKALEECDAAVRIGDKALFGQIPEGCHVEDMGTVWTNATGMPFVFAVWAARPGIVDAELYRAFHDSRREGTRAIDRIAEDHEWNGTRHPDLVRLYLREHIRNRLGSRELDAIRTFLNAAASLDLIDGAPKLKLAQQRWTSCHDVAATLARTPG